ncbi:MAG: ABC transporter ATP-binding protein [Acidimicrobiales bacterium]
MALLEVDGLVVRYGSISAVRDVDLRVDSGELVGVVGPNGAGKTSTLGAISGLLSPAAGTVRFDGTDVTGWPPDRMLRAGVALVPEHRRIFTDLTVVENLRVGGVTATSAEREQRLAEMVELFPVLERKWTTAAGYLSGGEAQQLAIARALMSGPRMLLMDEPSLGLAPSLVDVVFELLVRLRSQGRTLVVVEQNATRMFDVADRAYVMRTGEVVAQGAADELSDQRELFETYVGGGGPPGGGPTT